MADWPKTYHPAGPDEAGDAIVPDPSVTVQGWQLQPGTWEQLAAWCGGTRTLDPRGIALGSLDPGRIVLFGDYVMHVGDAFVISRADGHYQRWQLAT